MNLWEKKVHDLENEATDLKVRVACAMCGRAFDESTVKVVQARLDEITAETLNAMGTMIPQCGTAVEHYRAESTKWNKQIERANGRIRICEMQLKQLAGLVQAKELIKSRIDAAEAAARTRLELAETEENPHVAVFERHKAEVAGAEKLVIAAAIEHTKLSEELDHLVYWKEVYGKELKLKLFEDACPFLDSRTQYHMEQLGNPQIHCEFSTIKRLATGAIKEEFDVVVWSETGGRGFDSLSGGEQNMVSFGVGLALADLANRVGGSESGFLVLDEPFSELDDRNAEAVISYLQAEVEKGRDTIMLISNEESLKGLIHNRIHVVKKGGISNVESQ